MIVNDMIKTEAVEYKVIEYLAQSRRTREPLQDPLVALMFVLIVVTIIVVPSQILAKCHSHNRLIFY